MLTAGAGERFALVTGGSRGIGRAVCQRLAADGYTVFVNFCSDIAAAEKTVADIEAGGGRARALQADVGDQMQVRKLFQKINAYSGRLDVLVNNAGRTYEALLTLTSAECFMDVLKMNLLSAHMCSRAAIGMMLRRRSGCIVTVSSAAALRVPVGLRDPYAAAKAAMNALTKGFAREVAGHGDSGKCHCSPPIASTDMLAAARAF